LSAAIEVRRLFPGISDNKNARRCARSIAGSPASDPDPPPRPRAHWFHALSGACPRPDLAAVCETCDTGWPRVSWTHVAACRIVPPRSFESGTTVLDGLEKWAIWVPPIAWAIWWLWWNLPKREVAKMRYGIRSPKDRVEVEDTLRKTIGQALGAIAVLIGAGFALAQFLEQRATAQQQIAVSQKQVEISQQQVQASHDLLISNQIAKGFEQLGSEKVEVRLGGIYALEGILNMPLPDKSSSLDYRQPILEALCAFVREHTIGMIVADHPTTDVQAVLTVIGRRRPEDVFNRVNLEGANLAGADLSKADLRGANLSRAVLAGADLYGADLDGATMSGAHLGGPG
jgi:hypothetical protein